MAWVWDKGNICSLLMRAKTGVATIDTNMEVPQKTRNKDSI